VKVTKPVAALYVQPDDVAPREKVTGFPEPPPVAVGLNVPPTLGAPGEVDVKTIVWVGPVTAKLFDICAAGE
jgi:hypothetical protein